jgi:uncharacterized protein with beta-barrel porin domain
LGGVDGRTAFHASIALNFCNFISLLGGQMFSSNNTKALALAALGACLNAGLASTAHAQAAAPVLPGATDNAAQLSAGAAQLDLGSNFLQRMIRQSTYGYAFRDGSGGGGASQDSVNPTYRSWFEGYGNSTRTDAQGTFVGDKRKTWGGVAGVGMTVAPGFDLGVSIDQSRTDINVPLAFQSAKLDLTQIGINGAYSNGPWTAAFAVVHGFASIDAQRGTPLGQSLSKYNGAVDGVLGELSYYKAFDQSRLVPKINLEYVVAHTDVYQEVGGFHPLSVSDTDGQRARVMAGAEIGHYWIIGQQIVDVSGYGKFVDNFSQSISPALLSLGGNSISVQGIRESQYGADTGANVSWILSKTARFYANYDGKFRDGFNSQQGTVGVELKW